MITAAPFTVFGAAIILGDANCDGIVNMLDAITIVNYITGNDPQPFCFENADIDGNGIVNLFDFISAIELIRHFQKRFKYLIYK